MVNLGTYTTSQTWGEVANDLGFFDGSGIVASNRGPEYINWGSVTCDAGTPYTLTIKGSSLHPYVPGGIAFLYGENPPGSDLWDVGAFLNPFVRKIGSTVIPDEGAVGLGGYVGATPAAAMGTGSPQPVLGSVTFNYAASWVEPTDLLPPTTLTDTLTYTLEF